MIECPHCGCKHSHIKTGNGYYICFDCGREWVNI